eukprot:3403071-Pyramimonas_sp.AAC.1
MSQWELGVSPLPEMSEVSDGVVAATQGSPSEVKGPGEEGPGGAACSAKASSVSQPGGPQPPSAWLPKLQSTLKLGQLIDIGSPGDSPKAN